MADVNFHLQPAPADPNHSRDTEVRLCSFPPGYGKRYLSPKGERVVCRTGAERRWWLSMIRSGDVLKVALDKVGAEAWSGPKPVDRGSENVPDLVEVKGGKKGK